MFGGTLSMCAADFAFVPCESNDEFIAASEAYRTDSIPHSTCHVVRDAGSLDVLHRGRESFVNRYVICAGVRKELRKTSRG